MNISLVVVDPALEHKLVEQARKQIRAGATPEAVGREVGNALETADADLEQRAGKLADALIQSISRADSINDADNVAKKSRTLTNPGASYQIHPESIKHLFTSLQHDLIESGPAAARATLVQAIMNASEACELSVINAVRKVAGIEYQQAETIKKIDAKLAATKGPNRL